MGDFQNDSYWGTQQGEHHGGGGSFNFEMPQQQELNFQSFDSSSSANVGSAGGQYLGQPQQAPMYGANPYLDPNAYSDSMYSPGATTASAGEDYDDEPPLLEELGIHPDYIVQKTLTVLNPFRNTDIAALQDCDLAGPLVFILGFAGVLLLAGKVHFSYIYGIGVLGSLSMWALLSLMATQDVTLGNIISVLGYCLLPMVMLAGINVVFSLQGLLGTILTIIAIGWCSFSASKLFVGAYSMSHQQPLVFYPCMLLYGVFALITVF